MDCAARFLCVKAQCSPPLSATSSTPPSGGRTRCNMCAWSCRSSSEAIVIFDTFGRVERLLKERKATVCSNDYSSGITVPFVWPMQEPQSVEGFQRNREAIDPAPVGKVEMEVASSSRERGSEARGMMHERDRRCDRFRNSNPRWTPESQLKKV